MCCLSSRSFFVAAVVKADLRAWNEVEAASTVVQHSLSVKFSKGKTEEPT